MTERAKKFEPKWMQPRTMDEALAVLAEWAEDVSFSFSGRRAKRIKDIFEYERGKFIDECMGDQYVALIVNQLRDTAIDYHSSQQLRERLGDIIVPLLFELRQIRFRLELLDK